MSSYPKPFSLLVGRNIEIHPVLFNSGKYSEFTMFGESQYLLYINVGFPSAM